MKRMVIKTKVVKYIAGLALALSVTACASTQKVSSNQVIDAAPQTIKLAHPAFKVQQLSVTVPEELSVSEANLFLPHADIVWREDPSGDRRIQVQTILANAISAGTSQVKEGRAVTMEVRVNTFHAVTEKTRRTVGGRHNINFDYLLRDAQTGIPIAGVQNVVLKFKAYGGARAFEAMARGETQKVRITRHVKDKIFKEMSGSSEI